MMMRVFNKNGFLNIIWAFFALFLVFVIMVVATSIFAYFSKTPRMLIAPIEGRYKADLGLQRVKWLLDEGTATGFDPSLNPTLDIDINNDTIVDITVKVTWIAQNDFNISSVSKPDGATITAHYLNGNIDSIN